MPSTLARFAWGALAWNLAVVAWGAYVRATGSGAGCGAHWPLCNGEVVPSAPGVEMLVELSHRVSSGLALAAVAALLAVTWRRRRPGHPARRATAWAMVFMLAEAAVGAALVLFRLVADNASLARALFMSVHLVNTFLLLASLALAAWWLTVIEPAAAPADGAAAPAAVEAGGSVSSKGSVGIRLRFAAGAAAILAAGVSGAVAALGDTLFPSGSLAQSLAADLATTSHMLVRLRIFHPAIALVTAVGLAVLGVRFGIESRGAARRLGFAVAGFAGAQVAAGFVNVFLLAPVWMQIAHLLLADATWIAFVLLGACALAPGGRGAAAVRG